MFRVAADSVLLLGFSPVRADDVQTVLTKYVSLRGGPPFEAMQSFHEKGRIRSGGDSGQFEHWRASDQHACDLAPDPNSTIQRRIPLYRPLP